MLKILSTYFYKVMLISLVSLVFLVPLITNAQIIGNESTCKVTILSMEANPVDIYKNSQVKIHTKIQRNGCAENLDLNFEYYTKPDGYERRLTTCIDKPTHKEIIEFDCPYNFSNYQYWDKLQNSRLEYFLQVTSSKNLNYGDTRSWKKYFNMQLLGGSFTFSVLPKEPIFGQDLQISYTDFPFASSGKIYVNDDQHFVNISSSGNIININQSNGFKTGENTIRIVVYNDNTGNKTYDLTYKVTVKTAASVATYGCKAANGVYACTSNQNDAALNQACGIYFASQPADKCGCTDAEYGAQPQVKGKDCKANGGSGQPTPVSDSTWGCRAANGVYTCTNNQNDAALKQTCGTYFASQPADKCGCTDATYTAGTCKSGKPVTPGVQPANPGATPGAQPGAGVSPKLDEKLFNPLPTDSLTGTLLSIAKGFLAIVGLWGVTFIIIGGFKLVMAQGNEEAYLAAKKTIIWAVLGVVAAMLSFSIIAIVQNLIGATVPKLPTGLIEIINLYV